VVGLGARIVASHSIYWFRLGGFFFGRNLESATQGARLAVELSSLLKVSNLNVEYRLRSKAVLAVDDVSLDFSSGETLGVVGESGSGKTSLALALLKLIDPPGLISSGSIVFEGKDILRMEKHQLNKYRWRQVSMVYQSAQDSLNPVKPVMQPIYEVLRHHKKMSGREARETAIRMLTDYGISPIRAYDYPHEMSGGMRQRIVIALALALSPKILIADEPTSALDVITQKQILGLIKNQVKERGLSLIFITHEISVLNGLVEQVAVMFGGEIVEKGPIWETLTNPKHPYTEVLVRTLLTMKSGFSVIDELESNRTTHAMRALPVNACKFSKRCKYAFDRCLKERPRLQEIEGGAMVACHKYT
jgi:oligopeptide/dipeptide ABC transporter ATP-binding protein